VLSKLYKESLALDEKETGKEGSRRKGEECIPVGLEAQRSVGGGRDKNGRSDQKRSDQQMRNSHS